MATTTASEDHLLRTLRGMAWERAKGELESIMRTFWDERDSFEELDKAVKAFIKKIEDDGLIE